MSNVATYISQQNTTDLSVTQAVPVVTYLNSLSSSKLDIINPTPELVLEIGTILRGPPGPAGTATYVAITMVASIVISIHKAVIPDGTGGVIYADQSITSQTGKTMGISLNNALEGADVEVIVSGEVDEPTWNWLPGEVYLGVNGALTQEPPTSGILQVVGVALTATRLSVGIQLPILLN